MKIPTPLRRQWVSGLMPGFLFITAITCNREPFTEQNVSPDVDSLVDVFRMEALERGVHINISKEELIIRFGDLGSRSGSCKPNTRPKIVTLDSLLWRHSPPGVKEMLLAHELGHCLLGLEHDNAVLPTGECKSWMRETGDICNVNFVNKVWRDYYLDALFSGGKTSTPVWCDSNRHPAESVQLVSTYTLKQNRGEVLDTGMFGGIGNWQIILNIPDGDQMEVMSFGINEYLCAFYFPDRTSFQADSVNQTMMLYQYRTPEHNILSSTMISKHDACKQLIVERIGDTIFVFFDSRLKRCIPVNNESIKLVWYSSFDTHQNKMEIYKTMVN